MKTLEILVALGLFFLMLVLMGYVLILIHAPAP